MRLDVVQPRALEVVQPIIKARRLVDEVLVVVARRAEVIAGKNVLMALLSGASRRFASPLIVRGQGEEVLAPVAVSVRADVRTAE